MYGNVFSVIPTSFQVRHRSTRNAKNTTMCKLAPRTQRSVQFTEFKIPPISQKTSPKITLACSCFKLKFKVSIEKHSSWMNVKTAYQCESLHAIEISKGGKKKKTHFEWRFTKLAEALMLHRLAKSISK